MMRFKIRGQYWQIVWSKLPRSTLGLCDWASRTITISTSKRIKGELELDTICHEILHAAMPDMAEEAIDSTATSLARALTRLGYTRQP
jgi:hypothetical protein